MVSDHSPITGLVLHFRTPKKTLACLNAMFQEGVTQAILVDNSEDGGRSLIEMNPYFLQLNNKGFKTHILSLNKNLGFSAGVNFGLKHIYKNFPSHVLLINSDARLEKNSLSKLQNNLNHADIVAPYIIQQGDTATTPFYYYDRLFALITNKPKFTPVKYPSGCCLLIHKKLINTQVFEEQFFFYGEDIMLGYNSFNYNIKECSDAFVYHETSSSSKNGSLFYEYHINRAHWLLANTLAKNTLERVVFTLSRCFILPMRATVRCFRFKSLNAWYGLILSSYDILLGKFRSMTPKSN